MSFCHEDLAREPDIRSGPRFWGPAIWRMIHVTSLWACDPHSRHAQPIPGPRQYRAFMHALVTLLPCSICRDHLHQNLTTLPINESSISNARFNKLELLRWSYDLHSLVNQFGKKVNLPYSQLLSRVPKLRDSDCWGPAAWRTLHSIASAYEPEAVTGQAFRAMILVWANLIPPNQGGVFLKKYIEINPITKSHLKNARNLFEWTYDLHTAVNAYMGKPNISLKAARKIYLPP